MCNISNRIGGNETRKKLKTHTNIVIQYKLESKVDFIN